MTKTAIIGSRSFKDYKLFKDKCDYYLSNCSNIEIVSGGAKGADTLAEKYAKEKSYKFTLFEANWNGLGKSAGIIRNKQMADYCDNVIAFWDGESRGTKQMIEYSKKIKNKVKIVNYGNR